MKRKLSILLAFIILFLNAEVMAEKVIETVSKVVSEIELISNYEIIPAEETHTEEIPADYVYPFEIDLEDDGFDMRRPPGEDNISTFSVLTADSKTLWSLALIEQFSEEYLMPFRKQSGERVIGNTNRLIYSETDLSLEGKNGLDVNVIRKLDNQDYDNIYYLSNDTSIAEGYILMYLYKFKESENNEEIIIGFYTPDEFYMYMLGGAYLSSLPGAEIETSDYTFYDFNDICSRITDDTDDAIRLEPLSDEWFDCDVVETTSTKYRYEKRKLTPKFHSIGNGWKYQIPYVIGYRDSKEKVDSDNYDTWYLENSGVFCDMEGNVHSFENDVTYSEYNDDSVRKYTSTFNTDGDYIKYTTFYMLQTIEGTDIEYNMKVYDPYDAVTYYFYNSNGVVSSKTNCLLVAVVDDFENMIKYEYNDEDDGLCKITDTYGREIFLRDSGITYTNPQNGQIQQISYEHEILDSSELENDSLILGKKVQRLKVTNEMGETTIYDSRQSEVTSSLASSSLEKFTSVRPSLSSTVVETALGYDLERIIYPNGRETHYRYKNFYNVISNTRVLKSVHALCERYDIVSEEIKNRVEYEFEEEPAHAITGRKDDGCYTVSDFDTSGRKTSVQYKSKTEMIQSEAYTYDSSDRMIKSIVDNRGLTNTTNYMYYSRYKIKSETDNDKKLEYTYDGVGSIPKTTTYSYAVDSGFVEDYTVETTKFEDTGKVEYEKVIQDEEIKAQKKYEYDEFGNITAIYTWTEDTNADGVLDECDEYVLINGTHSVTEKNTHAYTSFAENILNVDEGNEGTVSVSVENNIFGSPVLQKDAYNNETRVEYDALNRPIRYLAPNGAERTIEYDNINNTAILTDENDIKIKYIYDASGNILQKQKLHNGEYKTFEEYTYDEYQKVLTAKVNITDDEGTISYYTYDDSGRVSKIEMKDFSDNLIRTENYSYVTENDIYKTSKTVTGADGATIATSTQGVDKYGNVVLESQKSGNETSSFTYTYDYLNRKTSETDANGNTTSYAYDVLGNIITITDAAGNQTSYDYDLGSRLTSQTDALGNTSEFFYDRLSRKVKEVLPFDGDIKSVNKTYYDKNSNVIKQAVQNNAPGEAEHFKITEFKYDAMGNVLASIGRDAGGDSVVQYEYNLDNKPTKMITGLSEYSENQTGGNVTSYTYQDGYLKEITDPLGQSESYTYDWLGNILTKKDRNEVNHTYTYGIYGLEEMTAGNLRTTISHDNLGRVTSQVQYEDNTLTDSISYTYDAFGRVISENQGNIERAYTYDANNNKTSYTLKENGEQKTQNTYSYNALNQLTNQTIDDTILTYQYNPVGNLISDTVGAYTSTYEYNDGHMLLCKDTTRQDTGSGDYFEYTYSLDGNRITSQSRNEIKEYVYDDLGRLVAENTEMTVYNDDGADIETMEEFYSYDNRGNRISRSSATSGTEYAYDANNRLLYEVSYPQIDSYSKITSYSYDANGNTTLKSTVFVTDSGEGSISMTAEPLTDRIMYSYDALNRLKGITGYKKAVSYTYGVDNLRKSKTVNDITTGYVWNGQNMVAETDGNTIQTIHNYSLDGIAKTTQNGEDRFYIKTGHGDVRWTVYENGELNHGYYYDAFGNDLWNYQTNDLETNMSDNPFKYCGEYFDEESDFIYLRNRYYSPANGRFITEDPIKDGLNWYVYCGGNPIMLIDPFGLFDYNTRLSVSNKYNVDTEVLQNELAWYGYYSGNIDGYFGQKTLDVVNAYKNDMGLGNTGNDWGVVGKQTWEYLGLTYRTKADIDAGITIKTIGLKQYKDVSVPVMNALLKTEKYIKNNEPSIWWFYDQVKDKGPWDIKRLESWEKTVAKGTYPGDIDVPVVLNSNIVTPEAIGNITYGYLGTAIGFSQDVLLQGGDAAANGVRMSANGIWNGIIGVLKSADTKEDKLNIIRGIELYNK